MASLRAMLDGLDPALLSTDAAVEAFDLFSEIERLGSAGKTLVAVRAAESDAWQRAGERSPADWMAKRNGTTVGEARATLEVAGKLAEAPGTAEALRAGALSARQAEAIAPAAAADPSSEQRLLDMAACQALGKLRDECMRVRAAKTDMEQQREELHRDRSYRRWTNRKGAACGAFELTPEAGAELDRLVKPFIDRVFDRARRDGRRESSEAYAADGLLDMARVSAREPGTDDEAAAAAASAPRTGRRKNPAIVIVNLESLLRGWIEGDELCEIPGVGQVSVTAARELLTDGLLRIVIRDGTDVLNVTHAGRCGSDVQFTAIQARQKGTCLNPTCRNRIDQIDHTEGFTITGATALDELGGLCLRCHGLKNKQGHTYRREPDGTFTWIFPDGTEAHERPPPVAVAS